MKPIQFSRAALWLALLLTAVATHAQTSFTASGRAVTAAKDSAAARVVKTTYQGKYSFVRIEEREPGAPENQHPLNVAPEVLRATLAQILLKRNKPEPVFNEEELNEIAAPLAQALAQATPTQEVSLAVTGQHSGFGPLALRSVTTARVFQQGGQLNVILGLVRNEFEGQLRGAGYLIAFEPGQRAKPVSSGITLLAAQGADATVQRNDWLKFARLPAATSAPVATVPAGVSAATPAAVPAPVPPPAAAAPTAPAAPALAAPASAPPVMNDALYNKTAERLKALQRLRDDGLITEKEFQEKRKAILAEF
jgi:hypothetical protein